MKRQYFALGCVAALSAGCGGQPEAGPRPPAAPVAAAPADGGEADGLVFEKERVDLGSLVAGRTELAEFPFFTGSSPVLVRKLETSCGCLRARLEVAGETLGAGSTIPGGSRGRLLVDFVTTGFHGRRTGTVTVSGDAPGLPRELEIVADLRPWCRIEPEVVSFGVLEGEEPAALEVQVTAAEPFRLLQAFAGLLEVEGVPSASPARTQALRVVVPASAADGPASYFVRARADNGFELQFPVEYEVRRPVYVRPGRRLHLGAIRQGEETHTSVDVGARAGRLAVEEVRLDGFPGARITTVTLEESRSYRIRIVLPGSLEAGPRQGDLAITLVHTVGGVERRLQRTVPVTALVEAAGSSSPPSGEPR